MSPASARWDNPSLRASLFHLTVFAPMAVSSVYLAIWLSEKGIQADQIGIVGAVPVAGLLILNLFIGRLADKAKDWRTVIVILALLGGAFPLGLFFVNEFWSIVLVWAFCAMSSGSIAPVIDAATMRLVQRTGGDFGSIRAWGTVGYVVAASGVGFAVTAFGTAAFVPLFFAVSLLRALMSLQLPRFRAPEPVPTLAALSPQPAKLSAALKPWFVLPLVAFALVNAGHGVLGSFAALLWHQHGVPDYYIGPLIATSALAEAVMMFLWQRFGGRVTARSMILAACIAALIRFTAMAFDPPVAVLFGLQTLHAVTYGVGYFGVVHFIANWTGEDIAAEAQGFATMLQQATLVVTLAGFGWLVAHVGVASYFAISVLSLLGIGCVLLSLRLRPPKDAVLP
jgi:PPP family 3-phenylpropionic acid transporter